MAHEKKQHVTLGEISEIQTGPFGSQLHASDYKPHGTPIITVEHLGENEILHESLPLVGAADRQRLAKYSLQEGDIVFTRVGAIDRRAYVSNQEHGWLFSGRLLRVRPTSNIVDGRFLSHLLGNHHAVQWIKNHAVGSTMACLNTSILSAVPLGIPLGFEQRRIAEILDTLDEAIRKTEQLIAKLKQVKQGLLHDLLTRGIDENGELRDFERNPEQFKKSPLGRIPKKWGAVPLANAADIIDPNPSHRYPAEVREGVPIASTENFLGDNDYDLRRSKRVPEYVFSEQNNRCQFHPHDVVFARKGRIGFARMYGNERKVFSHTVVLMKPKSDQITHNFLLWSVRTQSFFIGIRARMNSNVGGNRSPHWLV